MSKHKRIVFPSPFPSRPTRQSSQQLSRMRAEEIFKMSMHKRIVSPRLFPRRAHGLRFNKFGHVSADQPVCGFVLGFHRFDAARCHVKSGRSCHVMSCHVMSRHVTSRHVTSRHVTSRHVMSCHVMSCHVMSCLVLLYCVVSRREKHPQHIETDTSLSHYANARRSHAHSSYSYHSRSDSLRSHAPA